MRYLMEAFILCSKILQNLFYMDVSTCLVFCVFFHNWNLSQVCGKQRPFNPPVFLGFL